jgi:hypothetical protein
LAIFEISLMNCFQLENSKMDWKYAGYVTYIRNREPSCRYAGYVIEPSCIDTDLCKIQSLYHTKISRYQYKQDDMIINQAYQRVGTVDCHQDLTKC